MATLSITTDVELLKTLTKTLIDSVHGYREAAAHDGAGELRDLFLESAVERQLAVEKMQDKIRALGGTVVDEPSLAGQLHQRWLDLKAAIEGNDEDAILEEVSRGESYLQQKFQESIDDDSVRGEARRAIEMAYESVCARYDQVQALRRERRR